MPWNTSDLNPPTRFYFIEDGKDTQEYVSLRLASDADNKKFFDQLGVREKVEKTFNPKTRSMERMTFFDTSDEQREKFNELVWDFSIVEWNLLSTETDKTGAPIKIPCTKENKVQFMRESPKFASWIAKCLESLREALDSYAESKAKN